MTTELTKAAQQALEVLKTYREAYNQAWVPGMDILEPDGDKAINELERADGVKGHYAIGRWNPRGYREVWNLHSHRWAAYSDDVMSLEEADSLLRQITIPTARASLPTTHQATPDHAAEIARLKAVIDQLERREILAVAHQATPEPVGEPVAYREKLTGRLCEPEDTHRRKFPMYYEPLFTHPATGVPEGFALAQAEFNRAIDFAIKEGIGAAIFLDAWRHGDTSEWPEFAAQAQKGQP